MKKKKNFKQKLTTALLLIGLLACSALFVAWRIQRRSEARPPGHLAAVWDTSTSVPRNCDALVETVRAELNDVNVVKGSRFALITTGSTAGQFEPRLVLDTEITRKDGSIFKGSSAGKISEEFFDNVKRACREFGTADGSSIYRATQIGLEHVRTFGCPSASDCRLIIASDLEENVDAAVRKWLYRGTNSASSPTLLDNAGITVTFCGYTETTESGGPRTEAQSLVNGWKQLFAHPVTFRPYCGTAENESTASNRGNSK